MEHSEIRQVGIKWFVSLAICLILLAVSMMSISRGMADFYYYPVKKSISLWEKSKLPENEKEVRRVQRLMDKALHWDPKNPLLVEARGRISDWRTHNRFFWEGSPDKDYRAALSDFESTARLLPTSPWAWMNIALIKAKLGKYDSGLEQNLLNAKKFGPWRPGIHNLMIDIGLSGWDVFTEETQSEVVDSMRVVLRYRGDARLLIAAADRHTKKNVVCEHFHDHAELQKYCQKG